jgi:hypothetical protein
MLSAGGDNHTYTNARVSFSVFGNASELDDIMEISEDLEKTFAFQKIDMTGEPSSDGESSSSSEDNPTSICTHVFDQRVAYDGQNKIWVVHTDCIFKVGQ